MFVNGIPFETNDTFLYLEFCFQFYLHISINHKNNVNKKLHIK